MKRTAFFIILAFGFAAICGLLFWNTRPPSFEPGSVHSQINQLKVGFKEQEKPLTIVNLDSNVEQVASKELIDPKFTLPQSFSYPLKEWQALIDAESTGSFKDEDSIHHPALLKAMMWTKLKWNPNFVLPDSFFSTPPFMHPQGQSYAKLALISGRNEFQSPEWVANHRHFFHILDLLSDPRLTSTPINLHAWQLFQLLKSANITLTKENVLFLSPDSEIKDSRVFYVYPIQLWNQFLKSKHWISTANPPSNIFYRESNIYWAQNPSLKNFKLHAIMGLLCFMFTFTGMLLAGLFIREIYNENREVSHRLFILQMLTHELRTPTTSIKLSVESLRDDYDQLPFHSQKAFLRICEELQRLGRVVEASKNYLSSVAAPRNVLLCEEAYSINEFIQSLIESSYPQDSIRFHALAKDRMITAFPYWLEVCLRNLIDNAFHHGKVPVTISLCEENQALFIHVQDQGQTAFKTFKEMSKPFVKSQSSPGIGLGLAIAQKAARTLGGELHFSRFPTTFTLSLKERSA